MKKLMTMIAAVATAFGLYAADDTGTSFESATEGATLNDSVGEIQELPGYAVTTDNYWNGLDTAGQTQIIKAFTSAAGDNRPAQFADRDVNDRYLELSTGTSVLERYAKAEGATTDIIDGNLFFDSVVNMTAFEDAPTIPTDAKIAVWLQEALDEETQDPTATNLVVTVGGGEDAVDYVCGSGSTLLEKWGRVTVKALKLGNGKIGFVVFVNGNIVQADEITYDLTGYNANAKKYAGMKALFPFAGDDTTITAAGFAGKGSVDDLVFTETAPSFATDYAFCTISGAAGIGSFEVASTNWVKGDTALEVEVENGQVAVVNITADEKYFIPAGATSTNFTGVVNGDVLTVIGAKSLGATLEIAGQDPQYFENAAAALVELNKVEAATTATLTLNAGSGAITVNNALLALTLDLAGYTVDGAITLSAGALTIEDSSEPQTGKVKGAVSTTVMAGPGVAGLTINAGIYDGAVAPLPPMAATINDGKFEATVNAANVTLLTAKLGADRTLVLEDGYYVVKAVTDFTVEVPEAQANTKLAVTIDDVEVGTTNGTYTVAKASTLKAVYTADTGYTLGTQVSEFTVTYATKDTVTITAPTATAILLTATFVDEDGETVLYKDDKVAYNTTPEYKGETPTKAGYTFTGWTPTLGQITADETYTAQYTPKPVESIELDVSETNLVVADTFTLTATVLPADAHDKTVTWTVAPAGVVTLSADTGNSITVTAAEAGEATITAKAGKETATCTVTVTAAPAPDPDPFDPAKEIDLPQGKTIEDVNKDWTLKQQLFTAPTGAAVGESYYNLFDAVQGTEMGKVKFQLNPTGEAALLKSANDEIVQIKPADIAAGTANSVTIDKPIAGFYYAVKQGNGIGQMKVIYEGVLATGSNEVGLTLNKWDGAGFYKIVVSPTEIKPEN